MLKSFIHALLAATLLAASAAAGAQVREHTIKVAFAITGDNPQTRGAAFFKSEVERLSGGRMTVDIELKTDENVVPRKSLETSGSSVTSRMPFIEPLAYSSIASCR